MTEKTIPGPNEMSEQTEAEFFKSMAHHFLALAGARLIDAGPHVTAPPLCASVSLPGVEVFVDLTNLIDIEAEIKRKNKELEKLNKLEATKQKKLENKNFIDRAPEAVVQKERNNLMELKKHRLAALTRVVELQKAQSERM